MSILFDFRMTTTSCFLSPMEYLSPMLFSELMSILYIEVCLLSVAEGGDLLFFIFYVSLCLFIGELRPFVLIDINEQWLLIPAVLLLFVVLVVFVFLHDSMCLFPFFWFCWCEIIYPMFWGYSNFLKLDASSYYLL